MEQSSTSMGQGFYAALVKNMEDSEDERVRDWFLMDSFLRMIAISTIYVISCKFIGPAIMKNREPFSLKTTIVIYNAVQILCCLISTIAIIKEDAWVLREIVCDPDEFNRKEIAEICYWVLFVKLMELVETVFFVMRKKQSQVSNLHLYHHATTFVFAWVGLKYKGGLGLSTFILMNNLVHIIMYTYYTIAAIASAEINEKLKPIKKTITILQMAQFTAILLFIARYSIAGCVRSWVVALLFFPNVLVVYWMFYSFFSQVYKVKSS